MLRKVSWGFAGCLLILALVATTAMAQEKGQKGRGRGGFGFFGGGGGLVMLASNEAVQKEIGADEATVGKIRKIGEESRQAIQDAFGGGNPQNLSDEERQKRREKFEELSKKSSAQLKEALSADQYKRLQQIGWQSAGAAALDDEVVAKELSITDEQKKKIDAVREEYSQKRRGLGRDASADARRELTQEETKKATEALSAEQQEKFTALKGKAFDLSQLRAGGPGGARRRPKGDNN